MSIDTGLDVLLAGSTAEGLRLATVGVHVAGGLVAAVAGATAGRAAKGPGRHARLGRVYVGALTVVAVTAVALVPGAPGPGRGLLVLAGVSWAAARVAVLAHRRRIREWRTVHFLGMSTSYIGLLTGFYVDNGPRLPLWDRLPAAWFWFLPGLLAAPLVARAVIRSRARVRADPRSGPR